MIDRLVEVRRGGRWRWANIVQELPDGSRKVRLKGNGATVTVGPQDIRFVEFKVKA